MHETFAAFRVRENREFFRMDPEKAVAALKISGEKEIKIANTMIDETGTEVKEQSTRPKRIRKRFSFASLNVPIGAELTFTRDEEKKCKVVADNKVEYEGKEYSLSGLADVLLRELGYHWKSVQGPNFFEYNGKTLYQLKKDWEDSELEGINCE